MITKKLLIVATVLCAAVGPASAASADPNYYGVLSCSSCEAGPPIGYAYTDQVNEGINDGLAELQGVSN